MALKHPSSISMMIYSFVFSVTMWTHRQIKYWGQNVLFPGQSKQVDPKHNPILVIFTRITVMLPRGTSVSQVLAIQARRRIWTLSLDPTSKSNPHPIPKEVEAVWVKKSQGWRKPRTAGSHFVGSGDWLCQHKSTQPQSNQGRATVTVALGPFHTTASVTPTCLGSQSRGQVHSAILCAH